MSDRITGAEVRAMVGCVTPRGAHPVVEWGYRLALQVDADAANAGDAAEWKAVKRIIECPMAPEDGPALIECVEDGWRCRRRPELFGASWEYTADTPVELLALVEKGLAEAAKPKAERWRWMWEDGAVSGLSWSSRAEACRHTPWLNRDGGRPLRELRNPRGHVLLLPEGEPIPETGGPWE